MRPESAISVELCLFLIGAERLSGKKRTFDTPKTDLFI